MKKKTVVFPLMLSILLPIASACSSSKHFKNMKVNGEDIVLKIGSGSNERTYTANQLFDDLKNITSTPSKIFDTIEKVTIQAAQEITPEIKEIVDSKISDWTDSIKDEANASGTSYTALRKTKLTEMGYESVSDYRDALTYEQQKIKLEKKFWQSASSKEMIEEYVTNRLPYHVKHIFVQLNDNPANLAEGSISAIEAKKLGTVCRRIAESSFNTVASDSNYNDDYKDYSSILGGSGLPGDLGIMDVTSAVYPEFKLSTYLFDIYSDASTTQEKRTKLIDNDFVDLYNPLNGNGNQKKLDYSDGFRSIDVSDCSYLADISDKESWLKPDTLDERGLWRSDKQYARNVIFNNLFNFHDIGVITVGDRVLYGDRLSTAKSGNQMSFSNLIARTTSSITNNPGTQPQVKTTRNILTDGNGNPVFFVRSESGVHFIAIEKSPFESDAKEYYSNFENTSSFVYRGEETTGTPKQFLAAKKDVITSRVKSYIKNETSSLGSVITSSEISTIETLNLYARIKLVETYMGSSGVKFADSSDTIKKVYDSYISSYKEAQDFSQILNRTDTWIAYDKLIDRQHEVHYATPAQKQPLCMAYTNKQPSVYYGSCIYDQDPTYSSTTANYTVTGSRDISPSNSNFKYLLEIGSSNQGGN